MFTPNASGYKTRCENRRGKGTAKKICFKYPRLLSWAVVQEIPLASNGSVVEEGLVEETYILKWHYTVERARRCNLSTVITTEMASQ